MLAFNSTNQFDSGFLEYPNELYPLEKCHHFKGLALLALGIEQDPPVPIDGGVILTYVWPGFRVGIPPGQRPRGWDGDSFEAYSRYMTAILEWARLKQWTTTEVEATIYLENK
jgi:hypothetical protein